MFQSLHYLLTSEIETNLGTFPLNFLNGNRIEVGEIGWGSVTFYNSDDVKAIATALSKLNLPSYKKSMTHTHLIKMEFTQEATLGLLMM